MALPNLKRLRGSMTLERLSEETGISVSQLSRYERGGPDGRDPKLADLRSIARCLGASIEEVIGDDPPTPVNELASPPLIYRSQLQDSDSIQVEVGELRKAVRYSLERGKVASKRAEALTNVLVEVLSIHPSVSAVLRLRERDRSGPELREPEPGGQS